jgi:hypothetical protein
VREDGRIVGGEEWQENVCDREEWKKLLRMAKIRRILHMPIELNRIEFVTTVLSRKIGKWLRNDNVPDPRRMELQIYIVARYI